MKEITIFLFIMLITAVCVFGVITAFQASGKPQEVTIGPFESFRHWYNGYTLTLNGTYTFKDDCYYELHQGESIKQSDYEEENQHYWIRDQQLTGTWQVQGCSPDIFSSEISHVVKTPTKSEQSWNQLMYVMIAICVWLLLTSPLFKKLS